MNSVDTEAFILLMIVTARFSTTASLSGKWKCSVTVLEGGNK